MTENLDLDNNAYTVSYCCNFLNEKLKQNINNRQVKSLLINHYGENICFTYPIDRKKSQMFFSTALRQVDVVESLRNKTSTSDIISCTKTLESDIKLFKFQFDDVATCQSDMKVPDIWHIFMKHLCGQRSISDEFDRKSYVIFQQIYYFVHNGTKKSPLHMSIAQSIHNECRSKKLSKIMNRLSISISYDELERIDFTLANQLLNRSSVKYHSNSCYKPYTLKSERQLKINETAELSSIDNSLVEDEPSLSTNLLLRA